MNDNGKKAGATLWVTVAGIVLMVYLGSIGPSWHIAMRINGGDDVDDHKWMWGAYDVVYAPILRAAEINPGGIGKWLDWYVGITDIPNAPR
jgi:hypothetical protein